MTKPLADAIAFFDAEPPTTRSDMYGHHLRTLLAAARAQVPRAPTNKMLTAAFNHGAYGRLWITELWIAMYDASPINECATGMEEND